ncbi:MFS transporter [Aquipuribacter nitratireducens]|uniref:Nitrate/nitrite transporter n=1 Tax=Aquipuribacter nitratireducens TaxID=650104 RepID=A0ABW0GHI0_9MICO
MTTRARPLPAGTTRPALPWLVWGTGLLAYVVAVMHRTSLGVAGVEAQERFDTSASALASLAVVQLVVYAGLQVPVGVLLDRFGSRRLLVVGALVMAAGQAVLALATTPLPALAGRLLVGTGDAFTFISLLRLVPAWFPSRRVPLLTQLSGIVGQLGQVLSAVPLVVLLQGPGWTTTFLAAAATGVLVAVLVLIAVRDSPDATGGPPVRTARDLLADLVTAWRHPGTRLGLWTHFTTQFSGTAFALLWGFPYLVQGQGVRTATASALLTLFVLAGMVTGPVLAVLVQRHPFRRSWLVLAVVAVNALAWTVVLLWPGPAPLPLLVVLVLSLALGGPGSLIGFDFARTFNPPNRLGTATGIVNVGGFVASLVTIFLVGLVLDLRRSGASPGLDDFRVAMAVQYLVWTVGVVGIVTTRRRVRARLAEAGVVVPPVREALRRRREARRR